MDFYWLVDLSRLAEHFVQCLEVFRYWIKLYIAISLNQYPWLLVIIAGWELLCNLLEGFSEKAHQRSWINWWRCVGWILWAVCSLHGFFEGQCWLWVIFLCGKALDFRALIYHVNHVVLLPIYICRKMHQGTKIYGLWNALRFFFMMVRTFAIYIGVELVGFCGLS